MKRSYSLDVMKLFFACVVAVFHFEVIDGIYANVAVQTFFVISGYFLGRKYYSRSHKDGGLTYGPWRYTLDHAISLYPHYLLSLVVMLGYVLARAVVYFVTSPTLTEVWEMVTQIYYQVPDLLMLQSAYQYGMNLNNPTWQISALVIAGFFVYSLLCQNERLCRELLFPGAILMVQSLLATGVDLFGRYGFFFLPLLRAFAPLSLGVLVYYFSKTEVFARLKAHRPFFDLLSLLAVPAILVFKDWAGFHLVWASVLILACMEPENILNRLLNWKAFAFCGELSYAVYLNHALFVRIFHAWLLRMLEGWGLGLSVVLQTVVYLGTVLVYSVFTVWLLKKIQSFARKRKKMTV